MPQDPNRLSQFWQELKRRKVIRVITVYAASAFVILELLSIIIEPLRLPDWTLQFGIVFLCIGFIVAVILSWIYDIHPEGGVVKTESTHEVESKEIPKSSNSWKIASYISFVVIVVMISIMLYPKIFKPDKFKELRDESGMITLAVLPFNNLTGDSSLYFWQNGISELLINGLAQSDELLVYSSHVVQDVLAGTQQVNSASLSPEIARNTANKISASTHITGNYIGSGNHVSIVLNLVNTENEKLIWTARVDGDLRENPLHLIDRLSDTVRNYLEIKALEDKVETDLSNAFPNSADAYRHYIDGLSAIVDSNYEIAIESLLKAYELDTTFTFAALYLVYAHHFSRNDAVQIRRWINRARELKENIPTAYHPWIELWYAGYSEPYGDDVRRYCDILYETAHHNRFLLFDLGSTYSQLEDYNKSIQTFEKVHVLNQRWEDPWKYDKYYEDYCYSLLMADRPEEVEYIADIGLKINPKNDLLVRRKGAAAIMINDSAAVQRYKEDFRSLSKEIGETEAQTEHRIGHMYLWGKDTLGAVEYFRRAFEMDRERLMSLAFMVYCQLKSNMNFEECLKHSEYLLEQDPEDFAFLWVKGYSLHKLGRDLEALAFLREAEEFFPYRELQRDIKEVERSLALKEQQRPTE